MLSAVNTGKAEVGKERLVGQQRVATSLGPGRPLAFIKIQNYWGVWGR